MDDRVVRCATVGFVGGAIILVIDLIVHFWLHLTSGSWFGALSYLIMNRVPRNTYELAVGAVGHLFFGALLGAIFARFIVPEPGSGNYVLRGVGFSLAVWFTTFASGTTFHMPRINNVSWGTAMFQFTLSFLWGAGLGAAVLKWDESVLLKLEGQTAGQTTAQPAGQPAGQTKSVLYRESGVGSADAADQGPHALKGAGQGTPGGDQAGPPSLAEFSAELGALEARMTWVAEKLDEVSGLLREERADDGGWEHVEHLGFKVLHRNEDTEDRD